MHLCFALSWRTSWKPFVCFSLWFEHTCDFHCFIFMIFHLCSFSCYNMVAKFLLSRLYLHAHVLSSLISAFNALPRWSNCDGACHLKNYSFVITYLLEDEQELSLGMLIRLKRIYNFWCSMLVSTPFALCFVTLCGVFMRFSELTNWQDATVPVPCFLLFLCFRNATLEIFLELDETSSRTPIFPERGPKTKWEPEGGQRLPTPQGAWPSPGRTHPWWGHPGPPLTTPFHI
jgi:hypothetical protein